MDNVNVITEIGTKQDTIEDGDLTIAKTSGLQTALNGKQDTIENGDLTIANTNGLQTALDDKQDTIEDGDLTIAKTSGLQTALDNKYDDTGGTINGNVSITGGLLVGTTNIIDELGDKQDTIEDGDLTIAKTNGLQTALDGNESDIATINKNHILYNSNEYADKVVSNWITQTAESGNWHRVVYAPELNLFVAISKIFSGNRIMTSPNGIDWEYANNYPNYSLFDIVWSPELLLFVVVYTTGSYVATSPDGKNWTERTSTISNLIAVSWSPELSLFATISFNGKTSSSPDGITWTERQSINTAQGQDMCWSSELELFVAVAQTGTNRVAYSSDGLTWTEVAVTLNAWNGVIWSASLGLFVAVADSGTGNRVMTSTNGINWIDGSITDRTWKTITWSEELGIFLVVATDGYIAYSSDGFTWIESVLSGENNAVCWSAELGIFVIVRNDGVYTSSLKNRLPSNTNLFDSEFNSINESGDWTFKALTTGDLLVGEVNIITELGTKQSTIEDGDLTIAKTSGLLTALNDKYDKTGGAISGGVQISGTLAPNGNIFTSNRLVIQSGNTMEIQDDTEVKLSSGLIDIGLDGVEESITLNGFTYIKGSLDIMEDEAIYLNEVGGGNYTTINYFNYNKLTEDVAGKQDEINTDDLAITDTAGLSTALAGKQPTIEDGDLTIAKTDGLQTALNGKQSTITTATDLTSNSLTTTDLVVNESLNIDNVITYEKYKQFDTIVIRRFDEATTPPLNMSEIQVWVNNVNIMFQNEDTLTSYFASWSDKFVELDPATPTRGTELMYNNIITGSNEVDSGVSVINAIIINNIPLNFANDIQAIVLYHRQGAGNMPRAE